MRKEIDHLNDSCGDVSLDGLDIDSDKLRSLRAREYDKSSEHPTPEQLLLKEAIKHLTPKQRKVWEYHAYDKLTQDVIAKKLKVSQSMVAQHIAASEARIAKWCKSNMGAYELLKSDFEAME